MRVTLAAESSPWAPQGLQRLSYTSDVDGISDWAMMLPASAQTSAGNTGEANIRKANAGTWLVNLHGHGSTGDQLFTRQDIRDNWLPRFTADGYGILAPDLRGNTWMSPAAVADLHALLNYMREHHTAQRFIIASGSMGGSGGLIYASQKPDDISGVIALCPATDLPSFFKWAASGLDNASCRQIHDAIGKHYNHDVDAIARHSALAGCDRLTMPVYVVHGDADLTIPVDQPRMLAKAMQGKSSFHYHEQPGEDHDEPLWHMNEALDWLQARMG